MTPAPASEPLPSRMSGGRRIGRALSRVADTVGMAAAAVAAAALIAMTGAVVYSVGARATGAAVTWPFDLEVFTAVWLAMVGAAYTARQGAHVTAGISLGRWLRGRAGRVLQELRILVVCAYLTVITWTGVVQAHKALSAHEVTNDTLRWPVWVAELAIPVGAAAWLIVVLLSRRDLGENA